MASSSSSAVVALELTGSSSAVGIGISGAPAATAESEAVLYARQGAARAASVGNKKYSRDNYRDLIRMLRVLRQLGVNIPRVTSKDLIAYFEWLASDTPTTIKVVGMKERRPVKGETVKTKCITIKSVCKFMLDHWGTETVERLNYDKISKDLLETILQAFGVNEDHLEEFKKSLVKGVGPSANSRSFFELIELEKVCKYEIAQFKATGDIVYLRRWCIWTWALSFGCRPFTVCGIELLDVSWVNTGFKYGGPGWQLRVKMVFKDGAGVSVHGKSKQIRDLVPRRDHPALCAVLAYVWLICHEGVDENSDGGNFLFGYNKGSLNKILQDSFKNSGAKGPTRIDMHTFKHTLVVSRFICRIILVILPLPLLCITANARRAGDSGDLGCQSPLWYGGICKREEACPR